MDPQLLATVRAQLAKSGYTDIPDDLLEEFTRRLQEDDEFDFTPANPPPRTSPPKPAKKQKPPKKAPPPPDDSSSSAEDEPPPRAEPSPRKAPVKHAPSRHADSDDEIHGWAQRLQAIQAKARTLDSHIQECRSVIMDPPAGGRDTDVGLYFGTSERKLDPYPTVKRQYAGGGGFIRPPPVNASRKQPGSKKPSGKRLLYEERFPDYVPGPEKRRDDLRWEIRKKLAYSDPKYHQ
jgi:hypothetical protein